MRTRISMALRLFALVAALEAGPIGPARAQETGDLAPAEGSAVLDASPDAAAVAGQDAATEVSQIALEARSVPGKEEAYEQFQLYAVEVSLLLAEVSAAANREEPAYLTRPSYERAVRRLERLRMLSRETEVAISPEQLEILVGQLKVLDAYYFPSPVQKIVDAEQVLEPPQELLPPE